MTAALLPTPPELVSFDEVATVLDEAAVRARGEAPGAIPKARRYLAVALDQAGFRVIRAPADRPQLTP